MKGLHIFDKQAKLLVEYIARLFGYEKGEQSVSGQNYTGREGVPTPSAEPTRAVEKLVPADSRPSLDLTIETFPSDGVDIKNLRKKMKESVEYDDFYAYFWCQQASISYNKFIEILKNEVEK